MKNHNHQRTLSAFRAEVVEASKTILRWPHGDDRAKAVDLLRRAVNELLAAEGEAERGRDIDRQVEAVRRLIDTALNLKHN